MLPYAWSECQKCGKYNGILSTQHIWEAEDDIKWHFSLYYCKIVVCRYVDSMACRLRSNSCQEANLSQEFPC